METRVNGHSFHVEDEAEDPLMPIDELLEDELYDARGPACARCLDTLPIGYVAELCEECEGEDDEA